MLQKDKYIFILIFDQIIAEMMCLIRYCWNSFIPIFMIRAVLGEPIPFFSLFSLARILSTTAAAAAALRVMHQRCAMQPNYLPHASKSSSAIPQELHLIYERIIIKKKCMYLHSIVWWFHENDEHRLWHSKLVGKTSPDFYSFIGRQAILNNHRLDGGIDGFKQKTRTNNNNNNNRTCSITYLQPAELADD